MLSYFQADPHNVVAHVEVLIAVLQCCGTAVLRRRQLSLLLPALRSLVIWYGVWSNADCTRKMNTWFSPVLYGRYVQVPSSECQVPSSEKSSIATISVLRV